MADKYRKIDHLDEDDPLPNQKWVCVSFLSPEGIMNCQIRGLKVRGVFSTKEEADEHAKDLSDIDPDFHVFVGEVGKWLPWDPSPDDEQKVKDSVYHEDQLQELMAAYKDNRKKAQKTQKIRKRQQVDRARMEADSRRKEQVKRMRTKLKQRQEEKAEQGQIEFDDPITSQLAEDQPKAEEKQMKTKAEIGEVEKVIESQQKLAKEEHMRLREQQDVIGVKQQRVKSLAEKMEKMKELYAKRKAKQQGASKPDPSA